jgi:dipeptidyl aminopeptidase/acylaminoacyl peptidase
VTSIETIQSGGKPIRVHVDEPEGDGPFRAVLMLHGAGGNVYFWLDHIAPEIAKLGIAVYAVHYFDATGTKFASAAVLNDSVSIPLWLQVVRDTLHWIQTRPRVAANRIALIGLSLGGFIALALGTEAAPGGVMLKAIVDVAGGLAPPWDALATSAFPPTLIVHGENDPVVPVENALTLDALLTRLKVEHELHTFPHEGHWFSLAAQADLLHGIAGFLDERL